MESMRLGLFKASVLGAICAIGLALAQPANAGDRHHHGHRGHSSYGFSYGVPGFAFGYSDGYYGGPRYYAAYYPRSYFGYDPYGYSRPYYGSYYYYGGYYPRHHYRSHRHHHGRHRYDHRRYYDHD